MSEYSEALKRDIQEILDSGVNHTGLVMAMLQQKGWSSSVIVPLVYGLLLEGRLAPHGKTEPYRAN